MNFKSILLKPKRALEQYNATNQNCFVNPGHYYSPIVDVKSIHFNGNVKWKDSSPLNGIELNIEEQKELIQAFERFYPEIPFSDHEKSGMRYYYQNSYYSYSDALMLHFMIRHFSPKSIIEVGSGFSSAAMLDTREKFNLKFDISFIEPFPTRLNSLLTKEDQTSISIHEKIVQNVPLSEFNKLRKGDILLIDSTHITKTDSDVNYILFEVLPTLKSGVLIHFHDVFTGFEYPDKWIKEGRSWNEDYILRAFLMHNKDYKIKLFTHHMHQHHPEVFKSMPLLYKNQGANIWLEKI